MNDTIDKAAFLAALECLTKGWYVKNTQEEVSLGLKWRFYAGQEVGRLAQEWLGPGRVLMRSPLQEALDSTASALLNAASTLLFEASFRWGNCVARAGALRRAEGGWNLIEIKAGTSPVEDQPVKPEYIDDIAYTAWVARSAGLPILATTLVLVNREYRLDGNAPRFFELDVTEQALARASMYEARSAEIVAALARPDKPTPSLQFMCKHCPFFYTRCLGVGVQDSLFVLPRLNKKQFAEVREYERISRLPDTVELSDIQRRVRDVYRSGTARTDPEGLTLLDRVTFPVLYLDFEAVIPHFPWFSGRPPYDATPFQYSLHIRGSDGSLAHRSFLAQPVGDWRRELLTRLLEDLGAIGTIVVYSSYEKTRLRAIKASFPDFAAQVDGIIARLFDLEVVIKKGWLHPGFGGRTSIKKVLPVAAPDLTYAGLQVGNGVDAAASFALMRVGETPEVEHVLERANLEEYCGLDTLAMVRIHDHLRQLREQLR